MWKDHSDNVFRSGAHIPAITFQVVFWTPVAVAGFDEADDTDDGSLCYHFHFYFYPHLYILVHLTDIILVTTLESFWVRCDKNLNSYKDCELSVIKLLNFF